MTIQEQADKVKRLAEMRFLLNFPLTEVELRPFLEATIEMYSEHCNANLHSLRLAYPDPFHGRKILDKKG